MSCEDDVAIRATGLTKSFVLYDRPLDRLAQLFGASRQRGRVFHALQGVDFHVQRGEVVGIVGRNGAGKSTLLQIICGTLRPTLGSVKVHGRVAALLELGAGFNPDFTGRENIYFNAAILGLAKTEIDTRLDSIIAFADIGDFVDQPVRTYSSGMFVRLAFSVATSVDPDILIIDEALSVGDGAFARKSFDRVMSMREAGKTILFCSHSLYQIEALCGRALWLDRGIVKADGPPADVIPAYEAALAGQAAAEAAGAENIQTPASGRKLNGYARIADVCVMANGVAGRELHVECLDTEVRIDIAFDSDPKLPTPSVAVAFLSDSGETIASAGSANDTFVLRRDEAGHGCVSITFPKLPLLKGTYRVAAILACERAVHPYEIVQQVATLKVVQKGLEKGVVTLPHYWSLP